MIKFQLTFDDILAYNLHYMKKNGTFLQKYLQYIILLFFVIFMVANFYEHKATLVSYFLIIPIVGIIVFGQQAFSKFLIKKDILAYVKKTPQVVGVRELKFNDKVLTVTVGGKDTDYKFTEFIKLEEGNAHFFAYVSKQTAIIVPKRLLLVGAEVAEIIRKIEEGIAK